MTYKFMLNTFFFYFIDPCSRGKGEFGSYKMITGQLILVRSDTRPTLE